MSEFELWHNDLLGRWSRYTRGILRELGRGQKLLQLAPAPPAEANDSQSSGVTLAVFWLGLVAAHRDVVDGVLGTFRAGHAIS
jgi:hypothetical protein